MKQQNKSYCIYKHTSPSGKVYIGQTCVSVNRRWLLNGKGYKKQSYFYGAILKYGWDNFHHDIILEGISKSEADYAEKYLIKWYKLRNQSYNITDGGEGTCGYSPWNKGIKTNIVPWNKGIPMSDEIKQKVSKAKKGQKYGPQSSLHSFHKAEAHKIPIVQVDLYNPIKYTVWKSAKDVQDSLCFNRKTINRCLKNLCVQSYGYFWFYLDEFSPDNYYNKQELHKKAKIHYRKPICPEGINKIGINIITCLKLKVA